MATGMAAVRWIDAVLKRTVARPWLVGALATGAAAAAFSWMAGAIAAATLAAVSLLARAPYWGLVLFAVCLPVEFYIPVTPGIDVTSHEALLALTWCAWFVQQARFGGRLRHPGAWIAAAPFVLAIAASAVGTGRPVEFAHGSLRWLLPVAAALLAIEVLPGERELRRVMHGVLISAVALSILGVAQWALGRGNLGLVLTDTGAGASNLMFGAHVRAHGTFFHANHFAAYLILAAGCLIGLLQQANKTLLKIGYASLLAVIALAIGASFSRGGWIAFAIAAAIAAAVSPNRRRLFRLILVFVLAGSILLSLKPEPAAGFLQRFNSLGALSRDDTVRERYRIIRAGWLLFRQAPATGIGPGAYREEASRLGFIGMPALGMTTHVHCLYLQLLIEAGIAGAVGLAVALAAGWWRIALGLRRRADAAKRQLLAGLCFSICGYLIHNLVDVFLYRGLHAMAGLLFGAALALALPLMPDKQ